MMHLRERLRYLVTDTFQAVELPYGAGTHRMVILLPHDLDGLAGVVAGMDQQPWREMLDQLTQRDIQLALPRFSLEYKRD
jgi:serine protease inhibitor